MYKFWFYVNFVIENKFLIDMLNAKPHPLNKNSHIFLNLDTLLLNLQEKGNFLNYHQIIRKCLKAIASIQKWLYKSRH